MNWYFRYNLVVDNRRRTGEYREFSTLLLSEKIWKRRSALFSGNSSKRTVNLKTTLRLSTIAQHFWMGNPGRGLQVVWLNSSILFRPIKCQKFKFVEGGIHSSLADKCFLRQKIPSSLVKIE